MLSIVHIVALLLVFEAIPSVISAYGSSVAMKGPPVLTKRTQQIESASPPSTVQLALSGAIRFYRTVISPTQGPRCGFYPSCSAFGLEAIHMHGPVQGTLMTADRLTRCNLLRAPRPDYYPLPNGKLFDPVSSNLLIEP